jgi:hypothetical protein
MIVARQPSVITSAAMRARSETLGWLDERSAGFPIRKVIRPQITSIAIG